MAIASKIMGALTLLVFSGCAHSIHEVQTSDFAPYAALTNGVVVRGQAEQFVILGFTGNTSYVDDAYRGLLNACPNGSLTGITTQLATKLGFFSWTNSALMQGLCLSSKRN